jgi:hypothetical protein
MSMMAFWRGRDKIVVVAASRHVGGGQLSAFFLADNFVYIVIYLVSVHIHGETAHNYHAHPFQSVAGC